MRRILGSIAAALVLIVALMVFVDTSAAFKPDVVKPGIEEPPVFERDVKAPIRPVEGPEPPLPGRNVSFRGTIEDLPAEDPYTGTWDIELESGELISVEVTEQTRILPPGVTPEVNDSVHVLARDEGSQDGEDLVALKITVEKAQSRWGRPQHFRGQIEVLPADYRSGTWQVSGYSVTVDAETKIHPPDRVPTVGMVANVVAFEQSEETLWAMNIVLQTPEEMESEVEFEGPIEKLPSTEGFTGTWVVDSISVTVTADTELKGADPAVDRTAEVKGYEEDGAVIATWIKVEEPEYEEVEFEGALVTFTDTFPSVWVIDTDPTTATEEVSVTVEISTTIPPIEDLEVGTWVEVKALEQEGGMLLAIRIKVEDEPVGWEQVEFEGTITDLPDSEPNYFGRWTITNTVPMTVVVTPHTDVEGEPEIGATAEGKGFVQGDGYIHAESIKIEKAEGSEED